MFTGGPGWHHPFFTWPATWNRYLLVGMGTPKTSKRMLPLPRFVCRGDRDPRFQFAQEFYKQELIFWGRMGLWGSKKAIPGKAPGFLREAQAEEDLGWESFSFRYKCKIMQNPWRRDPCFTATVAAETKHDRLQADLALDKQVGQVEKQKIVETFWRLLTKHSIIYLHFFLYLVYAFLGHWSKAR